MQVSHCQHLCHYCYLSAATCSNISKTAEAYSKVNSMLFNHLSNYHYQLTKKELCGAHSYSMLHTRELLEFKGEFLENSKHLQQEIGEEARERKREEKKKIREEREREKFYSSFSKCMLLSFSPPTQNLWGDILPLFANIKGNLPSGYY